MLEDTRFSLTDQDKSMKSSLVHTGSDNGLVLMIRNNNWGNLILEN